MVFTTNKALAAWGQVLRDPDLAHAIVDRVLERGRLLRLDGPSLRTRHPGLDDPTQAETASHPTPSPRTPEKWGQNFRNPQMRRCLYQLRGIARRRAISAISCFITLSEKK